MSVLHASPRIVRITFAAFTDPDQFSKTLSACLTGLRTQHPLPWVEDASLGYDFITILDAKGSIVCRVRCRSFKDLFELGEHLDRINSWNIRSPVLN